jgi:hypothetical protein
MEKKKRNLSSPAKSVHKKIKIKNSNGQIAPSNSKTSTSSQTDLSVEYDLGSKLLEKLNYLFYWPK